MTFSNRLPPHAEINRAQSRDRVAAGGRRSNHRSDRVQSDNASDWTIQPDWLDAAWRRARPPVRRRSRSVLPSRERQSLRITPGAARVSIPRRSFCRRARARPTAGCSSCSAIPGEAVLVPQPSYPLFEHLTRLEAVQAIPYHLRYHGRWEIDFDSVSAAPSHVRALLLVSPNNPTGSFVSSDEARRLTEMCRSRGWAIVADEVFADYPLDVTEAPTESVMNLDVLSFTLGGASKSLGLPQIKLGWTIVGGPASERARALVGARDHR